jgi:GMP reductase
MDTVGTFEMAKVLAASKMVTCLHKHYELNDHIEFVKSNQGIQDYVALSSGTSDDDFKSLVQVRNALT